MNASSLYDHQFAYASGAAVTIPAGTSMLVGTDASGDAIELDPKGGGSGTPGGSDNQFQYNNGGAFGGSSGLTYSEGLSVPVLPTQGVIFGTAGGDSVYLQTDVTAAAGEKVVEIPHRAGNVCVVLTPIGTAGQVPTVNGGATDIEWATPTSDAPVGASYVTLGTNATLTSERVLTAGSVITLTDAGAGSTLTVGVTAGSAGQVLGNVSGTNTWGNVASYFGLGSGTLATSGLLRIASQTVDIIRGKLASTVEKAILSINTSDEIQLGSETNWTMKVRGALLSLWGASFELFSGAGGVNTLKADGTNLSVGIPMQGWASSSLMMRWKTQAMSFSTIADYTVSASEYEAPIWIISDSGGGPGSGNKILIAPAQAGAIVIIINNMTATTVTLKDSGGTECDSAVNNNGGVGFFVHSGTDWENVALPAA